MANKLEGEFAPGLELEPELEREIRGRYSYIAALKRKLSGAEMPERKKKQKNGEGEIIVPGVGSFKVGQRF